MQFGALRYRTFNLGDEIQTLAAMNYLPRVDATFDRDAMKASDREGEFFVICNGWWMHPRGRRYHFPPCDSIHPFFVSLHLTPSFRKRLTGEMATYLQQHAPIGCRDASTQRFLESIGVPAFWSGCLSMTLGTFDARNRGGNLITEQDERDGRVCLVDVPDWAMELLPKRIEQDAVRLTHAHRASAVVESVEQDHTARLAHARSLLDAYRMARLVVTSRLHCALPCLSFGTPVVVVKTGLDERFDCLNRFVPVHRLGEVINWDPPPADFSTAAGRLRQFVKAAVALRASPLKSGAKSPHDFAP